MIAMDETQGLQDREYLFPYHYLPEAGGGDFRWSPYWSWGYKYLSGLDVVLDHLRARQFASLIDVGCGDGRFLRELTATGRAARMVGVDYSERAIALARALNPGLDFRAADITAGDVGQTFDVVTLIEVLEHIPPPQVPAFVASLRKLMHPESILLVTVPHANEPVIAKHFQHFRSADLRQAFAGQFELEQLFCFDRRSPTVNLLQRLLFNRFFIVRHQATLGLLYRRYRERYLRCDEAECSRIGAIFRPLR